MRPRISSLLTSGVVAGFLLVGSAAFAQHGGFAGGHGGFAGGHAGFAGHAGGFSSRGFSGSITGMPGQISTLAPHAIAIPGRSVFTPSSHAFVPGFVPQSGAGFQSSWRGTGGWHGRGWQGGGHDGDHHRGRDFDHDRGRWRGGYGYAGAYPFYANSWELLPYGLDDSDFSGDDTDQGSAQKGSDQPAATAPPPDSGYRPQYSGNEGEPYPAEQAWAAPSAPSAPIAPEPELTLIFKDGHTQAIHNFVLTPSDLVVLDQAASGRQQRIPLDQLNLPATEKTAQQAGLDFTPPA